MCKNRSYNRSMWQIYKLDLDPTQKHLYAVKDDFQLETF